MTHAFTERSGIMALVSNEDPRRVDQRINQAVASAPWRGAITYLEQAGTITIAATGDADVYDNGRLLAVSHGRLHDPEHQAKRHQATATSPSAVLAAALDPGSHNRQPELPPGAYTTLLLDRATNQLRAARSIGGSRPLAWANGQHGIAVATEPRQAALLATGQQTLDAEVGRRYQELQPLAPTATFHRQTKWMTPGSFAQINDGKLHLAIRQPSLALNNSSADHVVEQLRAALRQAVSSALLETEAIGSMATGGLDCSSLIGYAAEHHRVSIAASTAVHGVDGSLNEARQAEKSIANLVGTHIITEIEIEDLFDGLTELVPTVEPPAGVLLGMMAASYRVVADHGAQTLLDGIGGDELFGLDPLRDAVADHDLKRTVTQLTAKTSHYRRRPRSAAADLRKIANVGSRELLTHTNHARWIWGRYNNWRLQVDGAARNRLAATLGLRLETPYLDERVLQAAANIPLAARMSDRRLQREVVSDVLAHAHSPMKVHGSDAQAKHFAMPVLPATAAAKQLFYRHFQHHHQQVEQDHQEPQPQGARRS